MRREQGSEQTVMRELSAQHLSRFDLAEGHDSPWTKHSSCLQSLAWALLCFITFLDMRPVYTLYQDIFRQDLSLPSSLCHA